MSQIYLVRHGQSEWNLLGLVQGQADSPRLTDRGRDQAKAAAAAIGADSRARGLTIDRIVSSDLCRAYETAVIIAGAFGQAVATDSRLREQALGWLEARPEADYWALAAEHDWADTALPLANGESVDDVRDRVASFLAEVGGIVVIVSHANAIRAMVASVTGAALTGPPRPDVPNGGVVRVDGSRVEPVGVA